MSSQLKAHLALFSAALIYGANYSIAKVVMDDGYIQPLGFIVLRCSCAAIVFSIFHYFFIREKVEKKDIGRIVLCALFGIAINQMLFFSGLKLTKPINAALIMTTTPILVLIISAFLLNEKITARKIIGIALGATGAILLISSGHKIAFNKSGLLGDLMIFINALSFGIYLVLVKSLMKKYHPITIVKWVFLIGWFFVIPFGAKDVMAIEWSTFDTSIWLATGYVLIFLTVLAYFFNAFALKHVSPSIASIYIYFQPLIATIIALMFATDHLSLIKFLSAMLIFLGVYLVSSKNKKSTMSQKEK